MVQQDRFPRDSRGYYSRGISWTSYGQPSGDHQNHEAISFQGPPPLDQVLREQARIPGKQYFLAVLGDNDVMTYFCSPTKFPNERITKFFNEERFRSCCAQPVSTSGETSSLSGTRCDFEISNHDMIASTPSYDESEFGFGDVVPFSASASRWPHGQRYGSDNNPFDDIEDTKPARKRQRANLARRDTEMAEDDVPPPRVAAKRAIMVSDEKELWAFYEQRFKNCQQNACKLIAKAWIKAVEPKKQSTHPYTGKDEKAPDWWPQRWGDGKDDKVRHKEPDHLYKRERLYLLNHILRMIVEPNDRQHRDIRKLHLNVSKLKEITMEALSSFFADKENPSNRQKKPYLMEIFKIALQEERFRAGQIDPTAKVYVSSDERVPDGYTSDNDEASPVKSDEEQDQRTESRSISPPKATATASLIGYSAAQDSTDNNNAHIHGGYMQQPMGSDLPTEHPQYVDGSNMSIPGSLHTSGSISVPDLYASPHETTRRSSFINQPSDYNSPTTPVYHGGWNSTSAPNAAAMYTIHEQPAGSHPAFGQPATSLAQAQQYISSGYDGLGRTPTLNHPSMFRSGSVGQGSVHHTHGYSGYMTHEAGGLPGSSIKVESMPRNM
ncbi:hypothetical protein BX600DRAFT_433592 [Xylariales sp. PMI_506]|nr:hypothetical protein BX600DRAFT_433592 [Xylariales sp. PMI_506]